MKTYDYMLLENMHKAACKDLYALRSDFENLNEVLRSTCEELDSTKLFLKLVADTCERAEVEVLALRKENAELFQAMQHPSYQEENRLRAELDALKAQGPVAWADVPDATAWLEDLRGNAPTPPRVPDGWKEATIAWEICASIHREWAKGKDAFYSTRQSDFVKHAADARKKALKPGEGT